MRSYTLKDMVYGSLREMLSNPKYIYNSTVDARYSEWTHEGQEEILSFLKNISFIMAQSDRDERDRRAKELVLENLKDNG